MSVVSRLNLLRTGNTTLTHACRPTTCLGTSARPPLQDFAPSWDRHVLTFFGQTRNDYAVNVHGGRRTPQAPPLTYYILYVVTHTSTQRVSLGILTNSLTYVASCSSGRCFRPTLPTSTVNVHDGRRTPQAPPLTYYILYVVTHAPRVSLGILTNSLTYVASCSSPALCSLANLLPMRRAGKVGAGLLRSAPPLPDYLHGRLYTA